MTAVIVCLADKWIRLDDDAQTLPEFPKLAELALVVTDFGSSTLSGAYRLEGNAKHASVLVGRRLRTEGAVDGESKVFIHAILRSRRAYIVLYSALNLFRWQKMEEWSRKQRRPCLIVPILSLLWKKVTSSQGVVARCGRNFVFLGRFGDRLIHCATLAFSELPEDMEMAASSLGDRVRDELGTLHHLPDAYSVVWHSVFAVDESGDNDRNAGLAEVFFTQAGVQGVVPVAERYPLPEGVLETTIRELLSSTSLLASENPFKVQLSWALETWASVWAGLFVLASFLILVYCGTSLVKAHNVAVQTDQMRAQAADIYAEVKKIAPQTVIPNGYPIWAQSVELEASKLSGFDVNEIIRKIARSTKIGGVRVLRIYTTDLVPAEQGRTVEREQSPSKKKVRSEKALIVDAALPEGMTGQDVEKLSAFVSFLRKNGFEALPLDMPQTGKLDGNVQAQVFSYRLSPVTRVGGAAG